MEIRDLPGLPSRLTLGGGKESRALLVLGVRRLRGASGEGRLFVFNGSWEERKQMAFANLFLIAFLFLLVTSASLLVTSAR